MKKVYETRSFTEQEYTMKTLYVFGNEYLAEDNFALKIANYMDATIIHCRNPDDLLYIEGDITILDVVKNIKKPMLITDINQLKSRNIISLHDFDLGFFLKLMKGLGIEKNIRIIGIPMAGDIESISAEVKKWL